MHNTTISHSNHVQTLPRLGWKKTNSNVTSVILWWREELWWLRLVAGQRGVICCIFMWQWHGLPELHCATICDSFSHWTPVSLLDVISLPIFLCNAQVRSKRWLIHSDISSWKHTQKKCTIQQRKEISSQKSDLSRKPNTIVKGTPVNINYMTISQRPGVLC